MLEGNMLMIYLGKFAFSTHYEVFLFSDDTLSHKVYFSFPFDLQKPSQSMDIFAALKEELTCAICHMGFNEPKDLQCSHTFCRGCLQGWHKAQPNNNNKRAATGVWCPVCRKITALNEGGIDGLKTNVIIRNLVGKMRLAMAVEGQS